MTCTSTCRKPNGRQAHCGACHETFSTVAVFDHHRTGHAEARRCEPPTERGMHRDAYDVWRRAAAPLSWYADPARRIQPQGAETGPVVPPGTPGHSEAAETTTGGAAWPNGVRCPVVDDWCPGNADGVLCTQPCNPREDDAAPALDAVTPDDTAAIRAIADGLVGDGVTAELEGDA